MKRRKFIGHTIKGAASLTATTLLPTLTSARDQANKFKIDSIELYRYDSNIPRYFSWGTWYNRQQVFMKISSGEHYGWSETNGSTNNPDLDLKHWGQFLLTLKGMGIYDAYDLIKKNQVQDGSYDTKQLEFMEMGLLDLIGRIENKPATALLGLKGKKAVPGLFCILNKDLKEVEENIYAAIDQNLNSHVKFKMYGKQELDLTIAKMARSILGKHAFIMSDVNKGYKDWEKLDELADILKGLRDEGLNAIEDPAELTNEQWIELQDKVGDMALIPDYVMRPSWKGMNRIEKGMGQYYNIHPDTMGSINLLPALGKKVKSFGSGIMIGDASLVGPACNTWQQIAIGLGASWVEAIEKKEDSESYLDCVLSKPSFRDKQGKFAMDPEPGFGLVMDEKHLAKVADQVVELQA